MKYKQQTVEYAYQNPQKTRSPSRKSYKKSQSPAYNSPIVTDVTVPKSAYAVNIMNKGLYTLKESPSNKSYKSKRSSKQ